MFELVQNVFVEIFETPLPGIGIRYEFDTQAGKHLGVLVHRDGQRDVLVYCDDDIDSCNETVRLSTSESASLVELLGGTKITERLSDLKHEVQGLSIEWVSLEPTSFLVNKTIGEGRVRTESGASVVAVVRGTESIPGPGPDLILLSGDTLLVIGSQDGVIKARRIITG